MNIFCNLMSILNLLLILGTFPILHLLTIFFQSASKLTTDYEQKGYQVFYFYYLYFPLGTTTRKEWDDLCNEEEDKPTCKTNSTEYSDTDTQRGQYEEHLNASVEQTKSSHNFCTSITIQAQGFRNVEHCYRSFIAAQAKHVQDYLMDSEFLLLFLCIHLQKSLKCMYLFSGSNK